MIKPRSLLFLLGLAASPLVVTGPARAADAEQTALPLREVALFSSGVGYFGRSGEISGDGEIPLQLRAPQLSDILKSLVLFDPKGSIKPVSYSIEDWTKRRPVDSDLPLDAKSTMGDLLATFQGAEVRFERDQDPLQGFILNVSRKTMKTKEGNLNPEIVTLVTDNGLREVSLETVTAVRFIDPELDTRLRATLKKRALNLVKPLDADLRSVMLRFAGKGTREVRAGYLLETAAWKTSYRLVLDAKAKPYLQGWAIVENTSDEDWKNVRLSLVSGRPVSFIQNLAAPLYVGRPVISVGIPNASPRPQTFGEGFSPDEKLKGGTVPMAPPPPKTARMDRDVNLRSRATGIFSNSGADDGAAMAARESIAIAAQNADEPMEAQAQGAEKGELFEYAIDEPVTLERNRAAMVPIVSQETDGEAITIIESRNVVERLVPANGFNLRNSSGLHLQGGAITVFANGVYAGDALITNISPNDSRLLTYALDLNTTARLDKVDENSGITAVSAVDGTLQIERKVIKTYVYALRNKDSKAKTIILQQPNQEEWELTDPKQLHEKSAEGLRFRFELKPGESRFYTVKMERPISETVVISSLGLDKIDFFASQKVLPESLKKAFAEIAARKRKIKDLSTQRASHEKGLKDINEDQARIRSNMANLSRDSVLYKQYEKKLTTQETEVEKLRAEIVRLRDAEDAAQHELDDYIEKLK